VSIPIAPPGLVFSCIRPTVFVCLSLAISFAPKPNSAGRAGILLVVYECVTG
jgi:hypothetical protein